VQGNRLSAVQDERALLVGDRTELSAIGAGNLGRESLGALLEQGGESALREAGGRGRSQVFHGLEIEARVRSGVTESTASNNFTPLGSEVADFLDLFGCQSAACHVEFYLVLRRNGSGAFSLSFYHKTLCSTKCVVASCRHLNTAKVVNRRTRR
jgi:hypothetical protein